MVVKYYVPECECCCYIGDKLVPQYVDYLKYFFNSNTTLSFEQHTLLNAFITLFVKTQKNDPANELIQYCETSKFQDIKKLTNIFYNHNTDDVEETLEQLLYDFESNLKSFGVATLFNYLFSDNCVHTYDVELCTEILTCFRTLKPWISENLQKDLDDHIELFSYAVNTNQLVYIL